MIHEERLASRNVSELPFRLAVKKHDMWEVGCRCGIRDASRDKIPQPSQRRMQDAGSIQERNLSQIEPGLRVI